MATAEVIRQAIGVGFIELCREAYQIDNCIKEVENAKDTLSSRQFQAEQCR